MQNWNQRRTWAGVATMVVLLGGAAAWAQAPQPAQPRWGQEHMQARLDRVRAELNLNAQQEAMWAQAVAQSREARRRAVEEHRALREWLRAELERPLADPRRLAEQRDAFRARRDADRIAVRELWLALYDTFDAAQKERAQAFMRQRLEQADRHARARERRVEPR